MSTEIIEGNKLIADFMGLKYRFVEYPNSQLSNWMVDMGNYETIIQYHSSWDWLMPVVEKIESIHDTHHGYFGVYISSNACTIQATNFRPDKPIPNPPHYFSDWTLDTKIKSTWTAVVYFIKWYQNQILNNTINHG